MYQIRTLLPWVDRLSEVLAGAGAVIIVIQTLWISYGVMMRYIFNRPDLYVTETTALLLVPTAFLGLSYALKMNALPRVTMITSCLPARAGRFLDFLNMMIMFFVGGFFAWAATNGFFRALKTGASSEVLSWPRSWFWAPVAISLIIFCVVLAIKFVVAVTTEPES
jgi:TRAP-type C4-dicarboxylate transport system permease small subunit